MSNFNLKNLFYKIALKKKWECFFESKHIVVENWWVFPLFMSGATIRVNGELLLDNVCWYPRFSSIQSFVLNDKSRCKVILGSKWHGCAVACHIYINDLLVGGDIGFNVYGLCFFIISKG